MKPFMIILGLLSWITFSVVGISSEQGVCKLCANFSNQVRSFDDQNICETCEIKAREYFSEDCCVCLEAMGTQNLEIYQCLHTLHENCRSGMNSCPICRAEIRSSVTKIKKNILFQPKPSAPLLSEVQDKISLKKKYELMHPMLAKFGVLEYGRVPGYILRGLRQELIRSLMKIKGDRFEVIGIDPSKAQNDIERLAALSAREYFVIADAGSSMNSTQHSPLGYQDATWTRWKSSRVIAEELASIALTFDPDHPIEIVSGHIEHKRLHTVYESADHKESVGLFYQDHYPRSSSSTPELLDDLYQKRLKRLLERKEPFTVAVITDSAPANPDSMKALIKQMIVENQLGYPGRECLASIIFIGIGDDPALHRFLNDINQNLIRDINVNADIVTVATDDLLTGGGDLQGVAGIGPFYVFWNAIY